MLRMHKILMDSADDNGSPSGYGSETATTTETPETTQTQGNTGDSTTGDTTPEGTKDTPAGDQSKPEQTTTEENVSGYGDAPKTGDEKPAEDDKPLELVTEGLEEDAVKEIQEFAKTNKLTKEQAQALVESKKAEAVKRTEAIAQVKVEEAKVYQKWEKELRDDPDFGGKNFTHSINNVNKLIREELPGIKKLLTGSGKKLPPSIMKDLNSVAKKLYGETEFVNGDVGGDKTTQKNPWDFYKDA